MLTGNIIYTVITSTTTTATSSLRSAVVSVLHRSLPHYVDFLSLDIDNLITLGAVLIILPSLDDGVAQEVAGEEGEEEGGHHQGRLRVVS